MAQYKHRPTQSGQAKPAQSLHEAAITLGHAGGKVGGPARAVKLTTAERHRIAKMGGEARGRQEGHTGRRGQSTLSGQAKKAAGYSEPVKSQGPPYQGSLAGRQPIHGPPRGSNPPLVAQTTQPTASYQGPARAESDVEYGMEAAPDHVKDILHHLTVPRERNAPAPPDASIGPAIQQYFDRATAAMGRSRGRHIG